MKYLLDTQILLWLFLRSTLIKRPVRTVLADPANVVFASAASTWEIAIKCSLGKLQLPGDPSTYLSESIHRAGLTVLPVIPAHTYGVFPLPSHHRDPFDRLLVAQAQIESMTFVTSDSVFQKYDVKRMTA